MSALRLAPVPPSLRIGIVSKPAHAKGLVAALRKAGVEPIMLGGAATSIPVTVDVILYRTASASHTSQPTLAAWSKQKGRTLISGNGTTKLIEELRTRGFLAEPPKVADTFPLASVPGVPETRGTHVPASGTLAARCYAALADGPLLPGEIALRLGLTAQAVRFATTKDTRVVNRYPASLGRRYGLLDRADRAFHGSPTLDETQERGRAAFLALKALKAGMLAPVVDLALPDEPARTANLPPSPSPRKRCAAPNRTDGKPCARLIAADAESCWHHRPKAVVQPTRFPLPPYSAHFGTPPVSVPTDDDPTATVRDEIGFVALWMREWNITGLTLLANGTVRLSDTPRKTEPVAVSFVVEPNDP